MNDVRHLMDALNWAQYLRLTRITPFPYPIYLELLILLFLIISLSFIAKFYIKSRIISEKIYNIFWFSWFFRSVSGIFLMIFYKEYYGWGDMWSYIADSITLSRIFTNSPLLFLRFVYLSLSSGQFINAIQERGIYDIFYSYGYSLNYYADYNSEWVSVLSVPFSLIGLYSYYGTTLLVATFSSWTSWLSYMVFLKYFPRYWREGSVGLLFMPSVWTWLGAPMKETYAMAGLSFLVYGVFQILENKKYGWIVLVLLGGWIAYTVKPYVIIAVLPWIFLWIYLRLNRYIDHFLYKYFFSPLLLVAFGLLSYNVVYYLGSGTKKYSFENILNHAYIVYEDLSKSGSYYSETGGSVYDIGSFEPTIGGLLSKFPIATVTALFRPFLWEARKPIILIAAVEASIVLVLLVWNLLSSGSTRVFRKVISHPFLIFCLGYGLTFLFMVGLTSGNFGNLIRYRLPGYTFFLSALLVTFAMARHEAARNRVWEQRLRRWAGRRSSGLDR